MANKKCLTLTNESYEFIIRAIKSGFEYDGHTFRPNERLATALMLEANLGIRISDIVRLRPCDMIKDGSRYRLNIIEKKTKKPRRFTIPIEIYTFILEYITYNGIGMHDRIIPISERAIQKQLKIVADVYHYDMTSTHSFRKYFGSDIYVSSGYDIELVRKLFQHSSVAVTQSYIGISEERVETALQQHIKLVV